jgi:formate hydrogenlyase subunit 3/multisubunit Na+/H+ antiporter MnhD subunit
LSPLTPLLILLAGAAGLLLGLLPSFPYTGLVSIGAALLAVGALLLLALGLPATATLSAWGPANLFSAGLVLNVDGLGWLFALAVLATTVAALVTGLARPGGRRVGTRMIMLLLTLAALMSFFAGNLLTRVLAWTLLDMVYFLALIFRAERERVEPQAVLNLAFNSFGTLLAIGATVLISRTSTTLSLRDAALTPQSTVLITLAAIFRLGLFPLHLALPSDLNLRQGLGTLLRLIPAAVALETLSRIASYGFPAAVRPWLVVFALAAALVGALQLWNISDPRRGVVYLVITQSGVALLGGLLGGATGAPSLTATALALVLGGSLIYLSNGHDEQRPWPSVWALAGAAALAGVPLTIGFLGIGQLYTNLLAAGGLSWLALVVLLISQTILVAGLLYAVFWPGQPLEVEPALLAAYFGGVSLPAILLVLTTLFTTFAGPIVLLQGLGLLGFSGFGSVAAMVLVGLTATGGGLLWRYDTSIRERAGDLAGSSLAALGQLGWIYQGVWGLIRSLGNVVDSLRAILEGEGAILWALVAGVLVWLLLRH